MSRIRLLQKVKSIEGFVMLGITIVVFILVISQCLTARSSIYIIFNHFRIVALGTAGTFKKYQKRGWGRKEEMGKGGQSNKFEGVNLDTKGNKMKTKYSRCRLEYCFD